MKREFRQLRLSQLDRHVGKKMRASGQAIQQFEQAEPARSRKGVLNEEKPNTPTGRNKIKPPLTRPASLEMTHYP